MIRETAAKPDYVLETPDWTAILAEVRGGSSDSLGSLLEEFRPYLLTIAVEELPECIGRKLGASDVVQDAIVTGYQSFATFAGSSREELAGWLRRILLNQLTNVVDAYHTKKRDVNREQPFDSRIVHAGEPTPSRVLLSGEERDRLDKALSRLPDEMRRVLILRHRDNLSYADLGRLVRRSETGARKLWSRAVRALRQELKTLETIRT